MKDSFQSRYGVEIKIGIGINTGEAHVGNLGSDQRFNYSVLGYAVNIAARVESSTKETVVTILTTRATLEAIEKIKNKIPKQRSMGKINLKVKAEPLELFEVLELS
jgi:adenylate cyclase